MSKTITISSTLSSCQWVPHKTAVWGLSIESADEEFSGQKSVFVVKVSHSFKATVESTEGENSLIYLECDENDVEIGMNSNTAGHAYPVDRTHLMHPMRCRNLCSLNNLHEAPLLLLLKQRFLIFQQIYTYTGGVLISINPYFDIPNLYLCGQDYQGLLLFPEEGDDDLPPHVFKIAANALFSLRGGNNQSVIISGESGAGKTEASKHVIRYLLQANSGSDGNDIISPVLVQGGVLFEAFGNAKTVRNDNSSRFGKYIKLVYNESGDSISTALTETFLLEKSRLVSVGEGERNYHIFYQMVRGLPLIDPSLAEQLRLMGSSQIVKSFRMLSMGGCTVVDSEDQDVKEFVNTLEAMKSIGITETTEVWSLLSCLLHLGNLTVSSEEGDNSQTAEVQCESMPVEELASLLGLSIERFLSSLTTQQLVVGKRASIKIKILKVEEVKNNISALIKWIYNKLFSWLVISINASSTHQQMNNKNEIEMDFIGILDIFGFEILIVNSFEQLCINFTNERLQQQFNEHVFSTEQQMYRDEGLTEWTEIKFQDNQHVIDLISKKPTGLLNILEEHGMLNRKPDDIALVTSFNQTHGQNSSAFLKSRFGGDGTFSVKHFAGEVKYTADGFLLKNNDSLQDDLVTLLSISSNSFLLKVTDISLSKNSSSENNNNKKLAAAASVSNKFREQLDTLINTLRQTEPHYIKCIKPNPSKAANVFQNDLVMQQLRYSGVLEVIRIRREGFPIRMKFLEFYDKYSILTLGKLFPKPRDISNDLDAKEYSAYIGQTFLSTKNFQLGHSHVFLRDESFEELRIKIGMFLHGKITAVQSCYRRIYYSRKFKSIKRSAIKLHALCRQFVTRKKYCYVLKAARTIKWFLYGKRLRAVFVKKYKEIVETNRRNKSIKEICIFVWNRLLGSKTRFIYLLMKYSTIIIQKYYRRRLSQLLYLKMKVSLLHIQTFTRMILSQKKYFYLIKMRRIVIKCVRNWIIRYFRNFLIFKKVVKVQVLYRKFTARKKYLMFKRSLISIQSAIRGKEDRKRVNILIASIIALQSVARMIKEKRSYRRSLKSLTKIQAIFRRQIIKEQFSKTMKKIIIVQSSIKMFLAKRRFNKIMKLVIKLQRFMRMKNCKIKFITEVFKIIKCQSLVRRYLKKKSFLKLKRLFVVVQSLFRMSKVRKHFLNILKKIISLQGFGRMISHRRQFMEVIISVVMIQTMIRMKINKLRYLNARSKIRKIQSIFRMRICYCHKQTQLFSIILLQSIARMINDRRKYITCQICTILLQSWWRKLRALKSYIASRIKVIKIQSLVRMKLQSARFRSVFKKVIKLQSFGRRIIKTRHFALMMISVIMLQTIGRGRIHRKKYLNTRGSIIKLQSWMRMLAEIFYYKYKILVSVNVIFKYYRMFRERKRYCLMIRSAKRIQVCARRYIRNNKLRYIILSLHDNLSSSINLFEEYKSELNKVKMLLGLKMVRNKWRYYCTIFHSSILGNNLKHLIALAGLELNLGVSLTRALSLSPTVKDVMELDILGRNSLYYLCMCPSFDTLRALRGSLSLFSYRESSVVLGGFEAEDDDDNKDRHSDVDQQQATGAMHDFKKAVNLSVKNNILKSGWLKKKRGGMMWQKRWVVLTEDYLVYYGSPQTMLAPKFAISLKDSTLSRLPGKDPIIEISSIHMPEKKSLFGGSVKKTIGFLAENEIELQEWLMPLKSVIGIGTFRINSNKPVHYVNYEIRKLWTSILDKKNQTPLHYLAMNLYQGLVSAVDEIEIACWLIENGCNLNTRDKDGNTPLHLAISNGSTKELVRCFVIKGSDITIKNNSNRTAISLLDKSKTNHDDVLKVLSSTLKLTSSNYIEKNRLAFDNRLKGFSYLTIFFTKQDSIGQRFLRPIISVRLFNIKRNLMEECLCFAEASRVGVSSFYWGSSWNMLIPVENLESGSFFIVDIQDENSNNSNVLWGAYTINLNEIDSATDRACLNSISLPNKNQKTQTLLNCLSSQSPASNLFIYFDVLIHRRNKDVGTLQDILG